MSLGAPPPTVLRWGQHAKPEKRLRRLQLLSAALLPILDSHLAIAKSQCP